MRLTLTIVAVGLLLCLPGPVRAKEAKPEASLSIIPKQMQVKVGQEVLVEIQVHKVKDLFGAPFYLVYDPHRLEAVKVSQGDFLRKDGKKTAFLNSIKKEKGRIIVGLTRLGAVGGVDGDGTLAVVAFKALQAGRAKLSFDAVDFKDSHQATLPVHLETGWVEVQ
jgi:general secretion pathway protein D